MDLHDYNYFSWATEFVLPVRSVGSRPIGRPSPSPMRMFRDDPIACSVDAKHISSEARQLAPRRYTVHGDRARSQSFPCFSSSICTMVGAALTSWPAKCRLTRRLSPSQGGTWTR